jgi:hypothetical protein
VEHAGTVEVPDEAASPGEQFCILPPLHAATDPLGHW